MKGIPAKTLLAKSVIYRVLAFLGEGGLAYLFTSGGTLFWSILTFIILVNTIKIGGYFAFDLIWIGVLRTRWNIIGRIKSLLRSASKEAAEEERRFVEEATAGAD